MNSDLSGQGGYKPTEGAYQCSSADKGAMPPPLLVAEITIRSAPAGLPVGRLEGLHQRDPIVAEKLFQRLGGDRPFALARVVVDAVQLSGDLRRSSHSGQRRVEVCGIDLPDKPGTT